MSFIIKSLNDIIVKHSSNPIVYALSWEALLLRCEMVTLNKLLGWEAGWNVAGALRGKSAASQKLESWAWEALPLQCQVTHGGLAALQSPATPALCSLGGSDTRLLGIPW